MKHILWFIPVLILLFLAGCGSDKDDIPVPKSFLGHLDIMLDTSTFRQISEDDYMMKTFGMSFFDTLRMGNERSFDLFILGQENFFHFSQAREFYKNQSGGMNLIFQSKKPEMKDSIILTWKKFTELALDVNTSKGTGFTLYEVLPMVGWTNIDHPRTIPFLTTYSFESYRTWGFGDSLISGVGMRAFMKNWAGPDIQGVLMDKIIEVHMNATGKELEVLKSGLFAAGYKEEGTTYKLPGSATIFVNVNENVNANRLVSIKMALSRSLSIPYEKTFNRLKVSFGGNVGWFTYQ